MRVLVHVPARGGSRGLPGKNLCEVGGRSLVARAVDAGLAFLESTGVDGRVVVDTDDERIAEEGRRAGAAVPFLRPAHLATDEARSLDVVLHAADRLEADAGPIETVILLQPTSPLRVADDIAACWRVYDPGVRPSVVSVVELGHPPELTMRLDADGHVRYAFGAPLAGVRRQELEPAFRPNGAVYIDALAFLRQERSFVVEGRTVAVPMPAARSIDIDEAFDLELARAIVAMRSSTPAGAEDR